MAIFASAFSQNGGYGGCLWDVRPTNNPLYFVRKRLNLKEGVQFVVVGEGDVVILKAISAPNMASFDALIEQARDQAEAAGLKRAGISKAVSKARARK